MMEVWWTARPFTGGNTLLVATAGCLAADDKRLLAEGGHVGLDAGLVVGDAAKESHGALAGEEVVVDHTAGGHHGKAAVLELGELHAAEVLLAHAKGIEEEVARRPGSAVHRLIDGGESADLEETDPEKKLDHGTSLVVACILAILTRSGARK
jgi:hypothetical protein